jgi:uncharacterized protein (DUF2461 family)
MQTIASIQARDRAERAAVFNIPSPRAKAFTYYSDLKYKANMTLSVARWAEENPAAYQWIQDKRHTNAFARSIDESLHRHGRLTDNQLNAVLRNIK